MTQPTDHDDPGLAPAVPGQRLAQALARLERSRAVLHRALAPAAPSASPTWTSQLAEHTQAWLRATPWGAMLEPIVGMAGNSLSDWWEQQTWRGPARQARDRLTATVLPWVRRHPWTALAISAVAGATLAASGVWRWRAVRRPALQLAAHLRRAATGQTGSPAWLSPEVIATALAGLLQCWPRPAPAPQGDGPDRR